MDFVELMTNEEWWWWLMTYWGWWQWQDDVWVTIVMARTYHGWPGDDVHTHRFYKTESNIRWYITIQPSKQNLKKCNRRIDESQSLKSSIHINEDTHRNGSPHAARHNRHIISIKQCKNRRIIIEGSRYIIIYRCIDTKKRTYTPGMEYKAVDEKLDVR